MTDAQRGNTKHGPRLDDELEQETRGMVQGHGGAPHVEPFRETEPLPDETDDPEVEVAFNRQTDEVAGDGAVDGSADGTVYTTSSAVDEGEEATDA
ncbi:hypothetical protein MIC448_2320023 [Microbacterium sp. C448]|uniref:hypothetical protein n=1 Tax=unclassified Microbacterium TaxID=2609290 RepID=UPI0003DE000E|nr:MULTISPECIES: hypothetical protein [unclassified Microbacterium]MDO8381693.1 hypothetical protein [Microbacterium sp.]CDK00302.1 hypothetical protein MIC448_2320023 [Microbacterium sp. C448]